MGTSSAIIPPATLGVLTLRAGSRLFAPSPFLTLDCEKSDPKTLEAFLERVDARKTLAKIRNKKIE